MKRITLAALAGTALLFAGAANAQAPDFSKVEIKTTDLGNKTYMLEGQGGNITVAVGTDGIIMVDSQFAPLHDKIKAAIAKISPLPVKYVINTHYHGDHVGGNAAFHKEGATIVARAKIAQFAIAERLPSMFGWSEYADAGGLMSYGANQREAYVRLAAYADKLLRGARIAELPIEQPTQFELVVNMRTAAALGITFPQATLLLANRRIE